MITCLIYSSIDISQAQTGNPSTTEVWVEQGNDVLLKDATKNVSVGDIQAQEKLHINGNVRIDGLQGAGNRFVLIDPDGKLIEGPPEGQQGGGPPKDIKNPGAQVCKPAVGPWRDNGGGLLQLCPTTFQRVHIGTIANPTANFEVGGNSKFHGFVEMMYNLSLPAGDISLLNGRMSIGKAIDFSYRMDINGKLRSTEMFATSNVEIGGNLKVGGTISSSSSNGLNFTENISTSGYLKSGNSIYVDGTKTGTDESNIIYSTNYRLSILGGSPVLGGPTTYGSMKFGIGTTNSPYNMAIHSDGSDKYFEITKEFNGQDNPIVRVEGKWEEGIDPMTGISTLHARPIFMIGGILPVQLALAGSFTMQGNLSHICNDPSDCTVKFSTGNVISHGLHIQGVGGNGDILLESHDGFGWGLVSNGGSGAFSLYNTNTQESPFVMLQNGDLKIAGIICAKEVRIRPVSGCDFVFDKDYNLRPRKTLEAFIWEKHHLPDIPSAKEMETNGAEVGSLQTKLLLKIEELTLYSIQDDKRIETLEREGKEKDWKIEEIEHRFKDLEDRIIKLGK